MNYTLLPVKFRKVQKYQNCTSEKCRLKGHNSKQDQEYHMFYMHMTL